MSDISGGYRHSISGGYSHSSYYNYAGSGEYGRAADAAQARREAETRAHHQHDLSTDDAPGGSSIMSLDDYRQDPPGEHWKNPYPARQGQEFCGHCGDDWPCEAVRDEPGHNQGGAAAS